MFLVDLLEIWQPNPSAIYCEKEASCSVPVGRVLEPKICGHVTENNSVGFESRRELIALTFYVQYSWKL